LRGTTRNVTMRVGMTPVSFHRTMHRRWPIKKDMTMYRALRKPLWMREFPTAWFNINQNVAPPHKQQKAIAGQALGH
jgi:hypothetical protein